MSFTVTTGCMNLVGQKIIQWDKKNKVQKCQKHHKQRIQNTLQDFCAGGTKIVGQK